MSATQTSPAVRRGRPRSFDRDVALRQAMEIFWQRGYEGASISELAGVMGITPPSLYAAFHSKDALFREAVALYCKLEDAAQRALRDAPTARAGVEAMLRSNVDLYTDPDKPQGCLVVLGASTWTPNNAPIREYLAGMRHRVFEDIRGRLQRGVADGELTDDIEIDAVASYYTALLQGLSIQARDGTSRKTMHAIIDVAMISWAELQKNPPST